MRYVAGFLFATAAAAHTTALATALGLAVIIFAGVVSLLFAVEAIVKDALHPPPKPDPTRCATLDMMERSSQLTNELVSRNALQCHHRHKDKP